MARHSLISFLAFAPSERGKISGLVFDSSGGAIAGAALSVVNRDTNATSKSVTTATGEFDVPSLLPGV